MADVDQSAEDNEPVRGHWNPVVVTGLLLLLAPLGPLLLPAIVVAMMIALSCAVSYVVPARSASTRIADLEADLTLRFYSVWNENSGSGRYLYVDAPTGRIRVYMTAFDWAHNGRTSMYRTPERKIAVLGPEGDDHLVSLDPPSAIRLSGPQITSRASDASENWTYLGAFDYVLRPDGERTLRFVNATTQPECIPMLSSGPYKDYAIRTNARQRDCQPLVDNDP